MKTQIRSIVLFVAVFSSVSFTQTDYQWVDPAGGSYADPNNWLPEGVPGPADLASFGLSATYPILFDADWTLGRLMVDNGEIDLDMGSRRLDLVWMEPVDNAAVVGHISGGKLLLTNGSVYSGSVNLGRNPGSFGALQVTSGGFWEARRDPEWQGIWIGYSGDADMTVDSGGIVRQGHGEAAVMPGTSASITVTGGSTWYVDGWFGMGVNGSAGMFVQNNGQAHTGRCEMGIEQGSDARAIISFGSSWELTSFWETSLTIGQRGSASLAIQIDSQLLNRGNMVIAAEPGSSGLLNIISGSATIGHSMAIGGTIDSPGGWGTVDLISSELLVGTGEEDRLIIWPRGKILMDRDSILQSTSPDSKLKVTLEGQLRGTGKISGSIWQRGGVLYPEGPTYPLFQLTGNFSQNYPGVFEVELMGSEDFQYSRLLISEGSATLDGNLRVHLADGYTPKNYEIFTILYAAEGVSGQFRNAPSNITFDRGTFDVTYTGDSVQLTNYRSMPFCDTSLPGDLNEDCRVDLLDLSLMAQNWLRCNLVPADLCQPQ
jgi:hypothetical protein